MRIDVLVFDGFDELDAIGPYEVLRNLADARDDVEVRLVTPRPADTVTASHGLTVGGQGVLGDAVDLVVVPGGGWQDDTGNGVRGEVDRGLVPEALARLHDGGATIAGVCTGAMLLGRAGLLEGRPATTHWASHGDLARWGAEPVHERVVDDGDVLTCAGVSSGLDLALWLVERDFGADAAEVVAREMEYERRGSVHAGPNARK